MGDRYYTGDLTEEKLMEDVVVEKMSKLSTVATSGDYDDLLNKPTIPTVPANVSAFTNDAGYLTQHQDISGKQDVLTAGTNITIQDNVISASGGSSDPNEIASGTVYTGKFSELPAFFESLEGKYCNGTVTYKITEDETITNPIEYSESSIFVAIPIFVPKFNIAEVVIDCNEKTLTNNISVASYTAHTIMFLPYLYKDALANTTTDIDTYTDYNSLNQKITIKNGNIIAINKSSSYSTYAIDLNTNINLNIVSCTVQSSAESLRLVYGNTTMTYNEFEGKSSDSTSNTDWGCQVARMGTLLSGYNSFKKYNNAIVVNRGGICHSTYDTFTNCTNRYMMIKSGACIGYSTNTLPVNATNTANSYGIVYNNA